MFRNRDRMRSMAEVARVNGFDGRGGTWEFYYCASRPRRKVSRIFGAIPCVIYAQAAPSFTIAARAGPRGGMHADENRAPPRRPFSRTLVHHRGRSARATGPSDARFFAYFPRDMFLFTIADPPRYRCRAGTRAGVLKYYF